ncbi:MAG: aspartyl protease family protein [Saprospiraceae bacterium]|nr:aspartyl protease family protein [Saprospiraceae bacterium]
MNRIFIYLLLLLSSSACKSIRISKLFQAGSISQEFFLEEIPFELVSGLIVLEVGIQGESYRMIFDTGAPNVISSELAQKLKLPILLESQVTDSQGGRQSLPYSKLDSLYIGNLHFLDFGAIVADWSKVPQLACFKVDGLIGANLMRQAFWQIDYEKLVIRISSDLPHLKLTPDTLSIPFTTTNQGTPHIDLKVGNQTFKGLTLDLGGNLDVKFSNQMLSRLKSEIELESIRGEGYGSAGIYGQVKDTLWQFILPEFSMAADTFPKLVASASGKGKGSVGNSFFRHFIVTLDWQAKRVYLSARQDLTQSTFYSFGFTTSFRDNQLQVGLIYDRSPAQEAGLQIGQQILQIADYDFRSGGLDTYCRYFLNQNEILNVQEIQIEVAEGDSSKMFILERRNLFD